MEPIGKLETVELRKIWPDEARDFTPWLARDGLELLGKAIGADLTLVEEEASVGPFSADIVAQVEGEDDHLVVIENQLGRTNHDHLGKIITYASGIGAQTVIWIAREFTEEHRQALDWLNSRTDSDLSFFAFRIELVRIGDSIPAPTFRVVSSPNDWTRSIRRCKRGDPSDTSIAHQEFWQELIDYMRGKGTRLSLKAPMPRNRYGFPLGRSGRVIRLTVDSIKGQVACELKIIGGNHVELFDRLAADKSKIESELNIKLEWQRRENMNSSRIVAVRNGNTSDPGQRKQIIEWLAASAENFNRVFRPRIQVPDELPVDEAEAVV